MNEEAASYLSPKSYDDNEDDDVDDDNDDDNEDRVTNKTPACGARGRKSTQTRGFFLGLV